MSDNICEFLPFGRSLALLAKSYFGALAKRIEHLEIERYYSILIIIDKSTIQCSQQYIAEKLKIDKVSMVRMIDYLIKKSFVQKVQNPDDRREYFVALTSKGSKLMPELYAAIEEVNKAALKGLTKEQQKIFYQNISTVQTSLDSLPSEKIFINYTKSNKKI
jgi:MarR family transcriptional regulator, transcriptional regulator for hemolysin